MSAQDVVEAAYAEVVARFGPVPEGSNARRRWFDDHRQDFHDACARIDTGTPAPPLQPDLFAGATP